MNKKKVEIENEDIKEGKNIGLRAKAVYPMRKTLLLLFLLLLMPCLALADQAVSLTEIGLTLALPDDYICTTKYDSQSIADDFAPLSLQLKATSADGILQLNIVSMNSSGENYLLLDDTVLLQELEAQSQSMAANGMIPSNLAIVRTESNVFTRADYSFAIGDTSIPMRQYGTLYNNLSLVLTFTGSSDFTPEHERQMAAIVDSLQWTESDNSYTPMTIGEADISFLRPEQWLYEHKAGTPFTTHCFIKTLSDGKKRIITLMYGDAAPTLTSYCGVTDTSEMDMEHISKLQMAYLLIGVSPSKLQSVSVNGNDYYLYRMTRAEGASADVLYQYFHLQNGIIYLLQFDAETDDAAYPVFNTFLESIQFLQ